MHGNKIGALPVPDSVERVVGILTCEDVFEALVRVTDCRSDTVRFQLTIPDEPGSIKVVTDRVRAHGLNLLCILTSHVDVPQGQRELILRVAGDSLDLGRELRESHPDLVVHRGC